MPIFETANPDRFSGHRALWIGKRRFRRTPRPKLNDTLLTTLTILLTMLVFIVAPFQASGVVTGRYFGLMFAAALIPAALMLAANWFAAGLIVVSIILIGGASEAGFRHAGTVDTFLDAMA